MCVCVRERDNERERERERKNVRESLLMIRQMYICCCECGKLVPISHAMRTWTRNHPTFQ